MATCNPQTLFSNAAGFVGLPPGERDVARLALLVQILQKRNPAYVLNVQTLMSNAAGFAALSPGQWKLIKLQLYCEILGGKS